MTVSELIQYLSDYDPNMEVYVTTEKKMSCDIQELDDELYSGHGKYRGVYISIEEHYE